MSGSNFNLTDNLPNTPTRMVRKRKVVTGTITLAAVDSFAALTTVASAFTITLPNANTVPVGGEIMVKDETGNVSATNIITFDVTGGGNIDGAATRTMTKGYGSVHFTSNGTNWFMSSDFLASAPAATGATAEFLISGPMFSKDMLFEISEYLFIPA